MALQQAQVRNLTVADETTAIATNFRINDTVTLVSTRRSYLCGSTSDATESIALNNGRFLNPTNIGITRTELTTTDTDLTIPTDTIDEFDFIFVEANASTSPVVITIPDHNTTVQKVITIARLGGEDVTITGVTSQDVVLSREFDSVECRQTATGGSQWAPTLSYSLMDRVPHEWTEFNEFTSGEQHFTNTEGIQNIRVYGLEEDSANVTFGTTTSSGVKTSKGGVGYIDDPMDRKLNIFSSEDIEIGTLVDGTETRVENFVFPNVASPDPITMPTDSGDNGDVMRVNAAGVVRFDDGLTASELLNITVNDDYTLTKSVADGRNNIRILATPKSDGSNYTITNENGINAWTRLTVIYDGSATNGTITVAPSSYAHGLNEIYLQKHGDYCVIEKTNSVSGSFWTFVGGQCETDTTSDIVGLYSSTLYDRLRDQSVEESLTQALGFVSTFNIPKSISDLGYPNGTDLSTSEAEQVFTASTGIDITVAEGNRSTWKSGTNSGFAIFCGGTTSDPTNPAFDGGEIIIPAEQLSSISEILITRASSSGSNPRETWCYLGDATSGGVEVTPFEGQGVHTPQNTASLVGYSITADDSTLPDSDVHLYFAKQFIKDITLVSSDITSRTVTLENSKNEIVNEDRTGQVVISSDGEILAASTDDSTGEISTLTMADSKLVFANESSQPLTDTSLTSSITYNGPPNKTMGLGDFATTDLTPTSPFDPDIDIQITGVNNTFTGDPTGIPELNGYAWNQSAQISSNYTQVTISNVQVGARVQVFFTAFEYGDDTLRVDPFSGFTTSTVETVTLTNGSTPTEYSSLVYTTNSSTAVVRLRGDNVTPYTGIKIEVTQDFPVPPAVDDSEAFSIISDDKGFSPPSLDPANVTNPVDGLLIRDNTDGNKVKQWSSSRDYWQSFDDTVRQRFNITSSSPNPKWYRVVTCQPTAHFKRDCTVTTEDGSHSQASDFTFGVRARINDGRNDQDSRSAITTMHMRNTTAFQYQGGSTVDTPIRAMRMVQEGTSDANRVVHIDLLLWQDSGTSNCNILWQPSKYPEEDNGVILDTVTEAPDPTPGTDYVEEYDLQGFLERNKDNYAVEFERSTGVSSFVQPTVYSYQVSASAGGNIRFESGSYILTNPGPTVTRDGVGRYTIDFPANTFPSTAVNVILQVSSNDGSSSSVGANANAFMLDREKIRVATSRDNTLTDINFTVSVTWTRQ